MSGQHGMGSAGMGTDALANATGAAFDRMWVSQMLSMHQAKLTELQTAQGQIKDPELRAAVTRAIPMIKSHRDMLSRMNTGTGNRGSGNNRAGQQ